MDVVDAVTGMGDNRLVDYLPEGCHHDHFRIPLSEEIAEGVAFYLARVAGDTSGQGPVEDAQLVSFPLIFLVVPPEALLYRYFRIRIEGIIGDEAHHPDCSRYICLQGEQGLEGEKPQSPGAD